jgi:hypothetical protein
MARGGASALTLAAALLAPGAAPACTTPPERAVYTVRHERYGEIGRHVVAFRCAGDDLVVEATAEIEVRLLLLSLYERHGRYREVWQGDRLIRYEALTEEGRGRFETKARLEDGRMVIDGLEAGVTAPATVVPSHPWNVAVVERPLLFDMKDGGLLHVSVEPAGEEMLTIAGAPIKAHKYRVSGDLERELWYDARGRWLQWRLHDASGAVTMTRQ